MTSNEDDDYCQWIDKMNALKWGASYSNEQRLKREYDSFGEEYDEQNHWKKSRTQNNLKWEQGANDEVLSWMNETQ